MEKTKQFKLLLADSKLELDESERKTMYADRHQGKKSVELAKQLKEVGELGDWLEQLGKYMNAEYDQLRMIAIPEAMEKEGLESPLNVAGVGRVSLTGDLFVSVGDKDGFYAWLRKNKMGDVITEGINPSTLKAWVKARIAGAKPYPTDFLKVTPFTRASITKAK